MLDHVRVVAGVEGVSIVHVALLPLAQIRVCRAVRFAHPGTHAPGPLGHGACRAKQHGGESNVRGTRFAAVCVAVSIFVGATASQAAPAPTPDAPKAMLDAIKTSPQAKLGPWLSNIYAEYKEAAAKGVTAKAFKSKNKALRLSSKGMVGIDAYANDAAALTRSLRALGATKVKARGPLVSAQVPVKCARPDRRAHIAALRAAVLAISMRCRRRRSRRATCRSTVRRRVPRTASTARASRSVRCPTPSTAIRRPSSRARRTRAVRPGHRERRAAGRHDDPRQG